MNVTRPSPLGWGLGTKLVEGYPLHEATPTLQWLHPPLLHGLDLVLVLGVHLLHLFDQLLTPLTQYLLVINELSRMGVKKIVNHAHCFSTALSPPSPYPIASFPGLPTIYFLTMYSNTKMEGEGLVVFR